MTIEEVEILRKKARNIILIGTIISFIIAIIIYILTNQPFIIMFGLIISIIITTILSHNPQKKFKKAFKETFVLKSLNNIFTDLIYNPESGLDQSVIRNTGMMYMGDRYSSNDYICGKYKNINIVQADVHIEERHETRDSNGHTHTTYETIFKGRWMIFDFNKNFKANIQVRQKGFGNAKINNWRQTSKYQKIMMEDQVFNNNFRTYAQSDIEAFYILTPSLMEKLKNLASKTSGKLLFCFIDNKLHIGIHNNKDSFEHGVFTKINEEKITNNIAQDINLITNFVDELNLDNDLFRREV